MGTRLIYSGSFFVSLVKAYNLGRPENWSRVNQSDVTSHWEMVPRFGFQDSNFKYFENFFCPSHANLILVNTVHCISVLNLTIFTTGKLADNCVWRDLWNNQKECFNLYPDTEKWVKKNKAHLSDWYSLSNNRNSREKLKWGFTKVFVISIQFLGPSFMTVVVVISFGKKFYLCTFLTRKLCDWM